MTTYNTGNPIGSTDPKDLYDNAQNLDALVNSTTELSHADRLGVQRKTWHGMEVEFDAAQAERAGEFAQFLADSAYQDLGVYGAGIEVTRYNQVFLKDGEFYRAAASLGLPYTTTGLWASESGSFVGVGDAVLRQDLLDTAPGKGAALVGFQQAGSGAVARTAQSKMRDVVSVKDFGAVGDGVTDDTTALNLAAAALQNGQSLYFPPGDYLVNTGCVLFRGKTRIDIFGAGEATRIRPSSQGAGGVKVDYHTTFAIDQCSFVTVRNLVIESKGENYGNTDAYGGLAGGDPRTNAIINYGGSAVLVSRSDHVTLTNVQGRYCGSVGVFYLSSCEEVVVENCFANARSLGYAGFAVDNWAESTIKTKRTYKFVNCRVAKEDATYAAKAGIAAEGDQATGRLLTIDVIGGVYEDCFAGGDDPVRGNAVSAYETRLTMTGVVSKNCYSGLFFSKRGGAVDFTWCRVNGCQFLSNAVTGAYFQIGTATGGADVSILNTKIYSNASSVWSGVGAVTDQAVKVSSGITVGSYINGKIKVVGCDIDGAEYGIYAIDLAQFDLTSNDITGSLAAIRTYGGGELKATGNKLRVTSGDRVIGRETGNYAASASYNLFTYVQNNLLECVSDTAANYPVLLGGNGTLFAETVVVGNIAPKGAYAVGKGSATLFDVDFGSAWTPVVRGSGTAGTYELSNTTRCTYIRNGRQVTLNAYIVLAGAITGGGTGDLQIAEAPYSKRADSAAWGTVAYNNVDYSVGKQLTVYFGGTSAGTTLVFWETSDNVGVTLVPISGVSAGDIIAFSISYEI